MKRIATKASLTPEDLTQGERLAIYRTSNLCQELRFLDHVFYGPLDGRPVHGVAAEWRDIIERVSAT